MTGAEPAQHADRGIRGNVQRTAGFILDPHNVLCPNGHRISRKKLRIDGETGYVWCDYVGLGEPPCGAGLHITALHRRARDPRGRPIVVHYAVEIDIRDRQYIESAQLDLFPMMDYLGQTYRAKIRRRVA